MGRGFLLHGSLLVAWLGTSSCTGTSDAPDGDAGDGSADVPAADGHDVVEGGEQPDADGPDGADVDVGPAGGPITLVITEMSIIGDRLCDLDGNSTLDNAVADLGSPASDVALVMLNGSLMSTALAPGNRTVLHFPWVEDRATPDDPDATLLVFLARDLDEPADPDDDFSGEEPFYARARSLDGCGEPMNAFEHAELRRGVLTAAAGTLPVPMAPDPQTAYGAETEGAIEPWGASADLRVCAYASTHDFGAAPGMEEAGDLTLLEMLLAGGVILGTPMVPGLSPDVDVDGDGVERFVLDEQNHVQACIDGDGTWIEGRGCWADGRIADGFSLVFRIEAVSAHFAGRVPDWAAIVQGTCDGGPPEESLFDPR